MADNTLRVNCNEFQITPELQREAATLRAHAECGLRSGAAVLEVDASTLNQTNAIAARTRTVVTADGRIQTDTRALREALQQIKGQFEFAVHQSGVEEELSRQLQQRNPQQNSRGVNVGVRWSDGRR